MTWVPESDKAEPGMGLGTKSDRTRSVPYWSRNEVEHKSQTRKQKIGLGTGNGPGSDRPEIKLELGRDQDRLGTGLDSGAKPNRAKIKYGDRKFTRISIGLSILVGQTRSESSKNQSKKGDSGRVPDREARTRQMKLHKKLR